MKRFLVFGNKPRNPWVSAGHQYLGCYDSPDQVFGQLANLNSGKYGWQLEGCEALEVLDSHHQVWYTVEKPFCEPRRVADWVIPYLQELPTRLPSKVFHDQISNLPSPA